jgi:hypothetical protein
VHLPEGGRRVSEELQAVLAVHDVESPVRKRQPGRLAMVECDRQRQVRGQPARQVDHGLVDVDTDDRPIGAYAGCGPPGDDPGAAGDVEDVVARPGRRGSQQQLGARREQRRHQVPFVGLRPIAVELKPLPHGSLR